jgi:acyl-ACP thioesterase
VALSDLDIVNHMNSVKYLEWCLDTINPKDLILGKLKSFEMNYLKELSLSDQATIAQNESVITINKDGKTCFALSFVV